MPAVMPRPERIDAARGPDLAKGRLVRKIARKLARPLDLAFKNASESPGQGTWRDGAYGGTAGFRSIARANAAKEAMMAKQLSPRARLKHLYPFLQDLSDEAPPTPETKKLNRKIARTLLRPLEKAFAEAALDINNTTHWEQLLLWLAWALYGGKGPGAPPKRTPKELRKLLDAVSELRAAKPGMGEGYYCQLLVKGKGGQGRYKGKNANTLRRTLQQAKALDREAQLLATPVREILGSETRGAKVPRTN